MRVHAFPVEIKTSASRGHNCPSLTRSLCHPCQHGPRRCHAASTCRSMPVNSYRLAAVWGLGVGDGPLSAPHSPAQTRTPHTHNTVPTLPPAPGVNCSVPKSNPFQERVQPGNKGNVSSGGKGAHPRAARAAGPMSAGSAPANATRAPSAPTSSVRDLPMPAPGEVGYPCSPHSSQGAIIMSS